MQSSGAESRPAVRPPDAIAAEHGIDLGRELTKGFAARYIRHKAKQIARRGGFGKSDIEDVGQQLILRVLENIAAFDPAAGHFNVFVKTVVERHTANILRDARADKRDRRRTCSLNDIVDEDESGPIELGETIGRREADARLGVDGREPQEACELVMDLNHALAALPPDLRDLCERLQHGSASDVARDLGVPRTTLYKAIRQLRKRLRRIGLGNY